MQYLCAFTSLTLNNTQEKFRRFVSLPLEGQAPTRERRKGKRKETGKKRGERRRKEGEKKKYKKKEIRKKEGEKRKKERKNKGKKREKHLIFYLLPFSPKPANTPQQPFECNIC